jgi:SWI/SNF-related matrix-associated actin-dependent regulator 1 of chromatin subfamily A
LEIIFIANTNFQFIFNFFAADYDSLLLQELWSLLEFMMPDLFATEDVDLKKLLNADDLDLIGRMKSILGPFILRRLKSDVMQQLVPKIQRVW